MSVPTMVRIALVGTMTMLLLGFASCSSSQADGKVVEVAPRRAVELIESGDYVVLDVRTSRAFRAGHVAGARHLPFTAPDFEQRVEKLDPDARYLVYSRNGSSSRTAAELMVRSGIAKVVDAGAFGPLAIAGAPLQEGEGSEDGAQNGTDGS